ncbi:PLP-dependent aspartate aminotransferase family protein [Silvimonas sp.]|uniref:trans-sulfuration enzyme family protein n=1 Tax=Silvimonas sp. TaxID=2650811 RepID=UPI00284645BB|nr:PLP-dependent aspartate aminotransferase family protein [Silvimonas sp.]MDR3429329.1 PLP-dependent aspartate aminotransferase family protein [Silvimonas sp.]
MLDIKTLLAQAGSCHDPATGAISMPIYQTATFAHPALGQSTGFDYTRSGNPTRQALEQTMAKLDGAAGAFAFASGLAAISTALCLFNQGDHVVVAEGSYGGTQRLLDQVFARFGISVTYVPVAQVDAFAAAILPNTRAILVESLSNPLQIVADLPALAKLAKDSKLQLWVDNTFLTPYWLRPLELGADLVIHSASKYLGGHNDTIAGILCVRDPELAARVAYLQNAIGAVLAPQDAWLTLRGLKTLALRLEQQQASAQIMAQWLHQQDFVKSVFYPGLPEDPGHRLLNQFATGAGAIVSFEVDNVSTLARLIEQTRLIAYAESLGGVESLITVPALQTHANLSPGERSRLGVTDTLVRLSVGIEAVSDLIADIETALAGY